MRLSKAQDVSTFSHLYTGEQEHGHTIRVLVDDRCFYVSEVILAWWCGERYQQLLDDERCIFLINFTGYSTQVDECLQLLHGKQVELTLENILIFAKFAAKFEIHEMMEGLSDWLKSQLNPNNLVEVVSVLSQIREVIPGKENGKGDPGLLHKVLTDYLKNLTKQQHSNPTLQINALLKDIPLHTHSYILFVIINDISFLLDPDFITLISSKVTSAEECEQVVDAFCDISQNPPDALLQDDILKHVQNLLNKISEMTDSLSIVRKSMKVLTKMLELTLNNLGVLNQFQNWRKWSLQELQSKKQVLAYHEFAVIIIDWADHTGNDILPLLNNHNYDNIDRLEENFTKIIYSHLNYPIKQMDKNVTNTGYKYKGFEADFQFQEHEMLTKSYKLKEKVGQCTKTACNKIQNRAAIQHTYIGGLSVDNYSNFNTYQTYHVVSIKFVKESDRLKIEVVPTNNLDFNSEHSHPEIRYINWYFVGYNNLNNYQLKKLYPVYTKTYSEIVEFFKSEEYHSYDICCFITS